MYFYLKLKARVIISEREKEFDKINSLKDQLKELQEKLGDTANTQLTAERAAIDKLLSTENSQQNYHSSARNVELETEIKEEESVITTLDATKGKISFCECLSPLDGKENQRACTRNKHFHWRTHIQKKHEPFSNAENTTKQVKTGKSIITLQPETAQNLFRLYNNSRIENRKIGN